MKPNLRRDRWAAICAAMFFAALFFVQGYTLVRRWGAQEDEVLFGGALYPPQVVAATARLFGADIPLMLSSYLGPFKAWLYAGIFEFWAPGLYSLRVPMLLAGGLVVWLFFRLLHRTAGLFAAVAGAALLATDTVFILTTCLDWGPAALQHLFLLAAMTLFLRFHQTGKNGALAAASLCCGLGIWDKASFAWLVAGLAVAAVAVYRREMARHFTLRRALLAAACLLLGSAPFLAYNLTHPGQSEKASGGVSFEGWAHKGQILLFSLDGTALRENVSRMSEDGAPRTPETKVERISVACDRIAGHPPSNLLPFALLGALLWLPFLLRTSRGRPVLFALIAALAAWAGMLPLRMGGTGVHHVVLLWPLPHMIVALTLGAAAERRKLVCAAALVLLCLSNLAMTNDYLARNIVHGTPATWSDASEPLRAWLSERRIRQIHPLDWGLQGPPRLLGWGRLPIEGNQSVLWAPSWNVKDRAWLLEQIVSPDDYFVAYAGGLEIVPGVRPRLREYAAQGGFREEPLALIRDRNSRPVFEVFRFAPALPR